MAKTRRLVSDQQVEVLHFPFMSLLACTIGALSFLLFIFVTYSKDLVDTSKIKKDILGSKSQFAAKQKQLKQLKEQIAQDSRFLADQAIPPPTERLQQRAKLDKLEHSIVQLERKKEHLQVLLARRKQPDQKLTSELEDLRMKAAMLKASRFVLATVKRSSESAALPEPIYVECCATEAVIWPADKTVPMTDKRFAATSFEAWLSAAGINPPGKYVVFLVRPSGIATFNKLRELSERSGFKVGYEPVLKDWEIFFS
ncbi:MAG: hypothetical protein DRH70_06890 [Candidatus Coatesbacteria bacterium]|nr:MAG: hypothetical protein DRH70_06890 [Candidatus Coatesbacteria bacterium]